MANAQVSITFFENRRGGRTLVHNQYMYSLKQRKNDSSYWNCIDSSCPARINTLRDHLKKIVGQHNHDQDAAATEAAIFLANVRRKCRESAKPIPTIFDESLAGLRTEEWNDCTQALVEKLPTFYETKSSLYRHRSKLHPKLPKSLSDVNIDGQWTLTSTGDRFLLADDGTEERILIFATEANLIHLAEGSRWYMDGTFYASPGNFFQLYSIHSVVNGCMMPLVYGLLPNKTQATYTRFFSLLTENAAALNIDIQPTEVMMDFEVAPRNVISSLFPDASVKCCFFHFTQAVWRKVQSLGLVVKYRDDDSFRTLVRRAAVLPLVPSGSTEDVWFWALDENDDLSDSVVKMNDYITETWVEAGRSHWNHFATEGPRTTNHIEGWHSKMNKKLNNPHPNIYLFMQLLAQEQAANEVKVIQRSAGGKTRPKKVAYRRVDQRLQRLKLQLVEGEIDIYENVDAASHLVKLQ